MKKQSAILLVVIAAGCAVSCACLSYFVWGMLVMQDLWDVSLYVLYLVGGLLTAAAATGVAEKLRRSHKEDASSVAGGGLIGLARLLLVIQVLAFLYCNVGTIRTVANGIVRRVVTYGMARDLPISADPSAS